MEERLTHSGTIFTVHRIIISTAKKLSGAAVSGHVGQHRYLAVYINQVQAQPRV